MSKPIADIVAEETLPNMRERIATLTAALRRVEEINKQQTFDQLYPDTASGWQTAFDDAVEVVRSAIGE